MTESEFERQYRVLDQMISMHASLGHRFGRRALTLYCGLLFASAVLCSVTFAPDTFLQRVGIGPDVTKLILGGTSAFVFALSIVVLRVDWEHVSRKHSNAAKRLAPLKHRYRECQALDGSEKQNMAHDLSGEYSRVMQELPQIPDRLFLELKAEHCFKRKLSKTISNHPNTPIWILKLVLRCRGTFKTVTSKEI
jgi:hypothetical protein